MKTKLILRLDDKLINRAKSYAKKSGKSVSQIVAGYFSRMDLIPTTKFAVGNRSHLLELSGFC